ncbi:hypothetical protein BL254_13640 [Protofrankia sp. BMG5.30]|uniref:Uncharacterized protein n=1 Tax=Protofrankia coriariae TaxID=1562887 RepID=A0ABR5F432_9ACTN|nr:hypothetical protein FrCorBMG51_10060 [Protofrankia coriariae]ONH34986.1 hypothetical protein BL254_13640 [Protofrankia sp. BMG5.30]
MKTSMILLCSDASSAACARLTTGQEEQHLIVPTPMSGEMSVGGARGQAARKEDRLASAFPGEIVVDEGVM